MLRSIALPVGLLLLSAMTGAASARDYKAGTLTIDQPWSRATPGAAKVGAGYMKITNTGSEPDRLIGGTSDAAERFELHETSVSGGVASMRPLEAGIPIRPGETVELKPGAMHVMLVNLKGPLRQGTPFHATLTFERAGVVPVEFTVEGPGAGAHGGHPGH
jgi:copper(I)-binding protein